MFIKNLKSKLFQLSFVFAVPSVAFAITSESENNNSDSNADGPLVSGTTIAGTISNTSDVDWYEFSISSPGTIDIVLDHAGSDDFDWYLYEETGGWIERGATSADPETGSYNATSTGTYFIKVERWSGTGWYYLTVDFPSGSGGGGGGGSSRPSKPGGLVSYVTGNSADAGVSPVGGPGILIMGGGGDVGEAFTNRAWPIANGGDVVVLRTDDSDGYNDFLYNLTTGSLQPDSVETIVIDTVSKANSTFTEWVLEHAEVIFIAGGDQAEYLNVWKGTAVEDAINAAYDKGAVIGGTSAGCAIQGEFIYDPDGVLGAITEEVVEDPYDSTVKLSSRIFDFPLMDGIITDTHFYERDRMGRLMTFMARLREDGTTSFVSGVGVSENTSLFINSSGVGIVDGDYEVYVLEEDSGTARTQINSGDPAIYENVVRFKLLAGDTFNFNTGASSVTPTDISIDGNFPTDPYTPSNPY